MNFKIRKGNKSDLPAIVGLVKELAEYENSPDSVTADVLHYEKCFDEDIYDLLVVEVDDKVVGMAIYYKAFSTWKGKMMYLEDFYVQHTMRNLGLGQALFTAFIEEAKKEDCKLAKWQVLDWNEGAVNFYLRNNAIIEKEWWNGKILF
jgi:GNAT superfamily N-acetyltransferase